MHKSWQASAHSSTCSVTHSHSTDDLRPAHNETSAHTEDDARHVDGHVHLRRVDQQVERVDDHVQHVDDYVHLGRQVVHHDNDKVADTKDAVQYADSPPHHLSHYLDDRLDDLSLSTQSGWV